MSPLSLSVMSLSSSLSSSSSPRIFTVRDFFPRANVALMKLEGERAGCRESLKKRIKEKGLVWAGCVWVFFRKVYFEIKRSRGIIWTKDYQFSRIWSGESTCQIFPGEKKSNLAVQGDWGAVMQVAVIINRFLSKQNIFAELTTWVKFHCKKKVRSSTISISYLFFWRFLKLVPTTHRHHI